MQTRDGPDAGASTEARGLRLAVPALAALLAAAALAYPALILLPMRGGKVLACAALSLGAFGLWRYEDAVPWLRGAAGERTVGRELRRLDGPGWRVRHDAKKPAGGNVDHVVVGPNASFTIETKLTRFTAADLAQARSHARYLARRLRRPVIPVLCIARSNLRPKQLAGVWCVGAPRLAGCLRRLDGEHAATPLRGRPP